jgi:hypothetical protein
LHDFFGDFEVWFLKEEFGLSACLVVEPSGCPVEVQKFFNFFFEEGCGKGKPWFRARCVEKGAFFGFLVRPFISWDATVSFNPP